MSRTKFTIRMLLLILFVTISQILAFETLFYQLMHPSFADLKLMATVPLIPSLGVTVFYIVLASWLVKPILRFLGRNEKRLPIEENEVEKVQERCLVLPYFLAGLSVIFYLVFMPAISWMSFSVMGWPQSKLVYAFLGAVISVLFAAPLYVYLGYLLTDPVLQLTFSAAPGLARARTAGIRLSVRVKLILVVISLALGSSGYVAIIGYSQTRALLDNMEKMEKLLPPGTELVRTVDKTMDPRLKSAGYFQDQMGNLIGFFISVILLASAFAVLLALAASREITRPVKVLTEAAERAQLGDYDKPVRLLTNDELAEMGAAINRMMETIVGQIRDMATVVTGLRGGIVRLDESVSTILAVSAEQSSGATEQATAIQETGSIAEEIVATARQIAEKAKTVDGLAGATLSACQDGNQKLQMAQAGFQGISEQTDQIGEAMQQIETRFEKTYKIVELMEDLADQTELLALNAALEAAGAGVEGRRFQVVAEATRRLALRSAESTREVKELVKTIHEATLDATRLAKEGKDRVIMGGGAISEAVKALKTISNSAGGTSTAVREITLSTQQQSGASEQLASSVEEVQEVAQRVEEGAKEIESAIAELRDFAETLRETVEK